VLIPTPPLGLKPARQNPLPTAFKLHAQCGFARVFVPAEKVESTHANKWGLAVHHFLEDFERVGRIRALAQQGGGVQRTCASIDVEPIPRGQNELSVQWNPFLDQARVTSRTRLVKQGDKMVVDEWVATPWEQYGRVDRVCTRGDRLTIVDWKTGDEVREHPGRSDQLLSLACAVACVMDAREELIDVALVAVRSSGQLGWRISTTTPQHRQDFARRACAIHMAVLNTRQRWRDTHEVEATPGAACRWCKIRQIGACPVQAAATAIANQVEKVEKAERAASKAQYGRRRR
jgi:hypothetical protein